MKANTKPLQPDCYYHIYNRGINGTALFKTQADYRLFLSKYKTYITPIANTFAYCLMGNHFHFLIKVKEETEILASVQDKYPGKKISFFSKWVSSQFAHMFNGYSQAFNKKEDRTGGLFESPFRRIEVDEEGYFSTLIAYIHHNPQKHGIIKDFRDYPYSSYKTHISEKETILEREEVLEWFGGKEQFIEFHKVVPENKTRFLLG